MVFPPASRLFLFVKEDSPNFDWDNTRVIVSHHIETGCLLCNANQLISSSLIH